MKHRLYRRVRVPLVAAALVAAVAVALVPSGARADEGFGANTPGGAGRSVVHVTNLQDAGPGSLREALGGGGRTVVFDVAGTIALSSDVHVRGAFVTIDGTTAPSPGITLRGAGLQIRGDEGAHDVIVRGLRVRGAAKDGLHIAVGTYNVLVDHVSVQGSGDGNIDITEAHDVTLAWSILAQPAATEKNQLIKYAPARITLHHNLYVEAQQRNPQVRIDDAGTPATETTVDMRNNIVWGWVGGYGTLVWYGPWANVVANFYASPASSGSEQARAVRVSNGARGWVTGNVSGDAVTDINAANTERGPFPAAPVTTQTACDAARDVVAHAGVRPLDAVDVGYLAGVSLVTCPAAPVPAPGPAPLADLVVAGVSAPATATAGGTLGLSVTTRNAGNAAAAASTTRVYLSPDATVDAGDPVLATIAVPSLAAGAAATASSTVPLPATAAAGTWQLIARADAGQVVAEANEGNNTLAVPLTLAAGGTAAPGSADLVVSDITAPRKIAPGASATVSITVRNRGAGAAGATVTRLYLSADRGLSPSAPAVGEAATPALAPGASAALAVTMRVPATTAPGGYTLVAVADDGGAVAEAREDNDTRTRGITVR